MYDLVLDKHIFSKQVDVMKSKYNVEYNNFTSCDFYRMPRKREGSDVNSLSYVFYRSKIAFKFDAVSYLSCARRKIHFVLRLFHQILHWVLRRPTPPLH